MTCTVSMKRRVTFCSIIELCYDIQYVFITRCIFLHYTFTWWLFLAICQNRDRRHFDTSRSKNFRSLKSSALEMFGEKQLSTSYHCSLELLYKLSEKLYLGTRERERKGADPFDMCFFLLFMKHQDAPQVGCLELTANLPRELPGIILDVFNSLFVSKRWI